MHFSEALSIVRNNNNEETIIKCSNAILDSMTLNEKIHMLSGHAMGETIKNVIKYRRFYNASAYPASGCKRLGVPTFRFTDGPRGVVMGNSTCFPVAMSRGASFDEEMEHRIGLAIAAEALYYNANYFAGICINLLRNPVWGRAQETYSEDPYVLSRMGVQLTTAVQEKGLIACPKHYALNSIENLRFEVNAKVDERTLHEVYLPHFKACIDAGAMSIMGAYNKVNGEYSCQNKILLKDILRDKWGFKGFTSSDFVWGVYDVAKALPSGMDVEMPYTSKYGGNIKKALKKGAIKIEDINWSVNNIIKVMLKNSLIITEKYDKSIVSCKKHTDLALEAAEKGMVLLKNENILPLSRNIKSIAILGRYANCINIGDKGSSRVYPKYTITPYQGIKDFLGDSAEVICTDSDDIKDAIEAAKKSEYVVICAGTDSKYEGEYILNGEFLEKVTKTFHIAAGGDRKNMRIPSEDVEFIKAIREVNSNIIVVLFGGSGFIINEWSDKAKGILMNWYSGMEGGKALSNILFGVKNPSGKLPLTITADEKDYPEFLYKESPTRDIDYGYYHGYTLMDKKGIIPDYPFGYGLSYTTYNYSNLKVKANKNSISATVNVTNIGKCYGEEIVMLFMGSTNTTIDRPVKLLKGFSRVGLEPNESKEVTINVGLTNIGFYDIIDKAMKNDDEYIVMVGRSSSNKDLNTQKVRINNA